MSVDTLMLGANAVRTVQEYVQLFCYCEEQECLPDLVAGVLQERPGLSERLAA